MSKTLSATVSGTVWKIESAAGERVEEGDDLLILESMKMEVPVAAESDCVVVEFLCKEGDAVLEGQALVVVDPE